MPIKRTSKELSEMIATARRQIDALPVGAMVRQGKHIRLDEQERRLFPKVPSK
jgi:hypothetical protein